MRKGNMNNTDGEFVVTRIFDAPRERVWHAWTDPETFKKWYGPKGFTCPVAKIDFRVGGKYLNSMRSPDGTEYWGTGTYREIVPMEKIVMTDSFADENGNVVPPTHYGMDYGVEDVSMELEATLTFEKLEGNKTRMSLAYVGFPKGVVRDQANAGWNETFDKMAEVLK